MSIVTAVDDVVLRGPQPSNIPSDPGSWSELSDMGVNAVLKLNFEDEGTDKQATEVYGMFVYTEGMHPSTKGVDIEGWIDEPACFDLQVRVRQLVNIVTNYRRIYAEFPSAKPLPKVYVHCVHGHDRTGLIIALYRLACGWTVDAAEKEMLDMGFHRGLVGLYRAWLAAKATGGVL
jgi:hypothetical protein